MLNVFNENFEPYPLTICAFLSTMSITLRFPKTLTFIWF